MRTFLAVHRWVSLAAALLLLAIACSGVWLQFEPNRMDEIYRGRLSDQDVSERFWSGLQIARRLKPGQRLDNVLLNISGDEPLGVYGFQAPAQSASSVINGPGSNTVTVRLSSGEVIAPLSRLHGALVQFHNSFLLGVGGRWVDVVCGLVLLTLSLTGLTIYGNYWRRRWQLRRRAPFWSHALASRRFEWVTLLRDLHRWLNTAVAVFLCVIAVSGICLHFSSFGDLTRRAAFGQAVPVTATQPVASDLSDAQLRGVLERSLASARRLDPGGRLFMILLGASGPEPIASMTYASDQVGMYSWTFSARSGELLPPPQGLGFFLLKLHRGDLFHTTGTVISIICGSALLLLVISGLTMFLNLWWRRLQLGRPALFWH